MAAIFTTHPVYFFYFDHGNNWTFFSVVNDRDREWWIVLHCYLSAGRPLWLPQRWYSSELMRCCSHHTKQAYRPVARRTFSSVSSNAEYCFDLFGPSRHVGTALSQVCPCDQPPRSPNGLECAVQYAPSRTNRHRDASSNVASPRHVRVLNTVTSIHSNE